MSSTTKAETRVARRRGETRRRFVTSGQVRLAVQEHGDPGRPTVLLVHGYPDTSAVWDEVVERLSDRFHVVSYDVRGAGDSSVPGGVGAYRLEALADDLAAVIGATGGQAPVHLVGHDWGAIQCWDAIARGRLDGSAASLTAIAGPSLDYTGQWIRERLRPSPRRLAQLLGQASRSTYIGLFHIPGFSLSWRLGAAAGFRRVLRRSEGLSERPGHPAPTLRRDGAVGIRVYRANIGRRLLRPRAFNTELPVQVATGSRERYVSPALAEGLERWVPNLWRRRIRGGHWLQRSHPDSVARWIAELVEHVEGAPPARTLRRARVRPSGRGTPRPRRFEDRLALVTGAGSGIGRATALAFAAEGAEVIAADIDAGTAEATVALAEAEGSIYATQVDVADAEAMASLAAAVERDHGVPDVLVNNAGIGLAGPFLDTEFDDWRRVLDVNLWGVIHGSRMFGGRMVRRGEGGHIANVASAAAFTPSRVLPAYATSKAAVLALSECLRAEFAGAGVHVSAICPGVIDTNITRTTRFAGMDEAEQRRRRAAAHRLYRIRNYPPERVAAAILRAVERRSAVVAVSPEAKAGRALARISPPLARALARIGPERVVSR